MRWDEDTYANLLPGVLYDLGEAADRVEIDYPFDDPHFTPVIGLYSRRFPLEIEFQQKLIAKHEAVIAMTNKWYVKVETDSLDRLGIAS